VFYKPIGATIKTMNLKNNVTQKSNVPDYLEPGDIIFFECRNYSHFYAGWDHCGLYIGNNEFIHASEYLGVVIKQNISLFFKFDIDIVFGKVKSANETQKLKAIEFAESQIGKPYLITFPKDPCPSSKEWYCSELLWAAYLHQGIDIDKNAWNFPRYVGTLDICWDNDVEMYEYHKMNKWYPGFYISWFINYLIHYPKNHELKKI
jgi:uncharacterized protein YycO